jgi:signal transduction histidine kinase/transcriptional regulator with GAF, ATPase, and Fis domain/ActR/RegA family two-component response regulator
MNDIGPTKDIGQHAADPATQFAQLRDQMLRGDELRNRLAADIARLGTFRYDPALGMVEFDERMRELWGERAGHAALPLPAVLQRIHPDDRERVAAALQLALESTAAALAVAPACYTIDCRLVWPDGSEHWVQLGGQALFDDDSAQRATQVVGTAFDITGRKQAELALRAGEEEYRALFDRIDEGFCVMEVLFDADARAIDCRLLEVNPAFERHTGITGACGKTMRELLVSQSDCWFEVYGAVARSGEAARLVDYSHSLGRWFDIYVFRVGAPGENRIALVFDNITERKQAEATLSLQTSQLETLLGKAPMGVYMVDADFRIRHVNPAALPVFGDIVAPVGRDFDEVIHALWDTAYADELAAIFRHTLATGEPHVETERSDARLGQAAREFYAWRVDRIRLSDGRHGVVCYFRDVSAEVLARRALADSEERQSYLLALSDALRPLADPVDIQGTAATLLGRHLRVSRAFYYEFDEKNGYGVVARDYVRAGASSLVGRHRLVDFTASHRLLREGRSLIVADAGTEPLFDASERANYMALHIQACIGVPLVKDRRLVAVLTVNDAVSRSWSMQEVALVQETAERTWAAVQRARAEYELRQRETQLALVQRIGGVGGLEIDVNDGLRGWRSPDYLRLHGLPAGLESETHDDWLARVHPEDRERADRTVRGALAGPGSAYECEYRIIRPSDGAIRWILAKADIVRDAAGVPLRLIGAHIDITSRMQIEDTLRRSEARLAADLAATKLLQEVSSRLIPEQRSELLYTQILDAALALMKADAASIQILEGNRLRLLADRNFAPASARYWAWVDADAVSTCGQALATGQRVVAADIEDCDFLVGTQDLEEYRRSNLRAMQTTPLVSRAGQLLGMLSTHWTQPYRPQADEFSLFDILVRQAADLLERSQAEAELRRNQERQAFLLELSDALRPLADPDEIRAAACAVLGRHLRAQRVLYADTNEAGLSIPGPQYSAGVASLTGEFRFENFDASLPERYREGQPVVESDVRQNAHLSAAQLAAFAALEIVAYVVVPLVKGGRPVGRLAAHFSAPHAWTAHEVELVEETAERTWEATERARAEAALRDSEELLREADLRKDEFLATLAHELRNPLATICTALPLLGMIDNGVEAGHVRHMLERQVDHMVRLIDDLMEVSRITRGAIELKCQPLDLSNIVRDAMEAAQSAIERAQHRVRWELDNATLPIHGDALRLVQIVSNLISNAVRYTDPGGTITIRTWRTEDRACVSIGDTGIGIAPEKLPGVFGMFKQIDRGDPRSQGGLGIGLALARRLARMHDGEIEAQSEGLGRGSTFTVALPLAASAALPHDRGEHANTTATVRKRVLVVDDNRDAADVTGLLLEAFGADVKVVHGGAAALALLEEWMPQIVLLDLGMPDMDGFEVARRVRDDPRLQTMALVALTGWGQQADIERTRAAGFDRHLVKPASADQLLSLLGSDNG